MRATVRANSKCAIQTILILTLAGLPTTILAQEDQSGAIGESPMALIQLDDARVPVDARAPLDIDRFDVRDSAAAVAAVDSASPLWMRLADLSSAQRANAMIELELGSGASAADRDEAAAIATQWNRGHYDVAIERLRALEEAGTSVGVGVTWRVPQSAPGQRMLDYRIGDPRDDGQTMSLDFDAQSGNLLAVVRWGSTTGTSAWSVNISTDSGTTWLETYAFVSSVGIIDVDCAVADDYLYIAYVAGNATDEARLRRAHVADGTIEGQFGYEVVFHVGDDAIDDVALASNADDNDNRIYYVVIQSNDELRWAYDVADDGTTFVEDSPTGADPEFGLDMTWDHARGDCNEFVYVSYSGSNGDIHVLGHSENDWIDWTVDEGVGSFRATAVSAYGNSIICAYEYPFADGTGIKYAISYDCGQTWNEGTLAVPDGTSTFGYFEPDVDARNGHGMAIVYQAEAGEFDPLLYRTRVGFAPGAWSDPTIFGDFDAYTGSDTVLAYLPPLGGEPFSHGAMYLSLDPDFRTPYFDRPAAPGPACGDTTPPAVHIDSPAPFDCACSTVDVTGSVDDPDGSYARDQLEVRRHGSSTWVPVSVQNGPRSGVLHTWSTGGQVEAFYDLRIVGENECGAVASDSTLVYKPTSFQDLGFSTPQAGGVYGGDVCLEGTASSPWCFEQYVIRYRPTGGAYWVDIDPSHPVYTSPVVNDSLALWRPTVLGLADGDYNLRLTGRTVCGNAASFSVTVTVDNTPPIAELDAPGSCEVFTPGTTIDVRGEVADANLDAWTLAVIGGPYTDWHTIAGPSSTDASGLLGSWDTTGLPACGYTIRLQAVDQSMLSCGDHHHVTEDYRSIVLGGLASADLNNDGMVDMFDFLLFQLEFTGPMP